MPGDMVLAPWAGRVRAGWSRERALVQGGASTGACCFIPVPRLPVAQQEQVTGDKTQPLPHPLLPSLPAPPQPFLSPQVGSVGSWARRSTL